GDGLPVRPALRSALAIALPVDRGERRARAHRGPARGAASLVLRRPRLPARLHARRARLEELRATDPRARARLRGAPEPDASRSGRRRGGAEVLDGLAEG